MMKYRAYITRVMSQTVEFEAKPGDNLEEAAMNAPDVDLDPNISNKFEADGDEQIYYIEEAEGGKRVFGVGTEESAEEIS